jgi:predicted TPR repeat methyltransferase
MSKNKNAKIINTLHVARELHNSGQITQAIATYKKVLRTAPTHPDALHYLGLAYYQTGNIELAITHVKRAVVLAPTYPDAKNNLANIYKEVGRLEDAFNYYSQVLEIAPNHTDALVNIAVILREIKHSNDALVYVKRALALEPSHAVAQHNLGNIYADLQQYDLAYAAYRSALQLNPLNHNTSKSLAHILNEMGRNDEAIQVLKYLILQSPNDAIAKHLLSAYQGDNIPNRATDLYVKQTFDAFSTSFDMSLARLKYQAPQLIRDKVLATCDTSSPRSDILDIGCGTGLCGPFLKPFAHTLIGVDLSAKMLSKAQQLTLYDELHEAELCAYMQSCDRQFDYVVCADTFVYFGELQKAFEAVHKILRAGGYFIFTVELHRQNLATKDYHLQVNGRYSHSLTYLRKALETAEFEICSIEDVVLRMEYGKEVEGALVVALKH